MTGLILPLFHRNDAVNLPASIWGTLLLVWVVVAMCVAAVATLFWLVQFYAEHDLPAARQALLWIPKALIWPHFLVRSLARAVHATLRGERV